MGVGGLLNPLTTFSTTSASPNSKAMASVTTANLIYSISFDRRRAHAPQFLYNFKNYNRILIRRCSRLSSIGRFGVSCESKIEERMVRRYSPCLEKALLTSKSNGALASDEWRAVPDIWRTSAEKYGDRVALVDPCHDPPTKMTYKELEQEILHFSEGLRVIGLKPNEKLALFADNSCRWLVADQGMMAMGAINTVRGSRSSVEELLQIYNHSESVAIAVDSPELFNRIAETFSSKAVIRFIILLWGDKSCLAINGMDGIAVFNYKEIIDLGRESHRSLFDSDYARQHYMYETISSDDIATLVYTSGTTGNPKGVMLTHNNLLHQEDLQHYQPHYMISVPLVYETLYSGVHKQISTSSIIRRLVALTFIKVSLAYMELKRIYEGTYLTRIQKEPSYLVLVLDYLWARIIAAILLPVHKLADKLVYSKIRSAIGMSKAGISGGGSLPSYVDEFFEAIGMKVQNGYGMTESSPVTAARRPTCNVLGSIGHPIQHTEFKITDAESGETLPDGSKGIVKVRGPQVMKGYYKNPMATKKVLDEDGWLNTGDIGWIVPHHSVGRSRRCGGVIVLEGRAKDTIVLSTGENVEPSDLEEAAMRSALIQQIVVVGQDQRRLGAIVVPNKEEVLLAAKKLSIVDANASEMSKERMTSLVEEELRKWTSGCSFQIGPILIVDEPFTIEGGLMTPTMKIRRDRVTERYREQIANLYK
ncbi:probable acyl-activating enzyme 16, chloroplastic isoform X2 [Hevea brasiliensis]|uniref:probable acyl-activating enzyme 16, chloroplastic isoform X2 n=1 Tax=Hevea brasiliensis TaxID=3981 RepID=UPI0025E6AF0C|nr:probable acyl-activating enzyme 16, chloroplastic isoform X2 [Hevea brasiliensis]